MRYYSISEMNAVQEFHGWWRLREFAQRTPAGTVYPFGRRAQGVIAYDPSGLMSVVIVSDPMPRFSHEGGESDPDVEPEYPGEGNQAPQAKLADVYDGCLSYFGTYVVDETTKSVSHHVEGSNRPGFVGKKLVRTYSFDGDLLSLSPPSGAGFPVTLVWQRVSRGY